MPPSVPGFSDNDTSRSPRGGRALNVRGAWLPLVSVVVGAVIAVVSFLLVSKPPSHPVSHGHGSRPLSSNSPFTAPQLPPPGMHVSFRSTFDGPTLDRRIWFPCYAFVTARAGCTNYGNKQEVEWYLPSQVRTSHGVLELTAAAIPTTGKAQTGAPKTFPYRSGMVTTYPAFQFTYGYVQVVARVPHGAQFWPAVWFLPATGASLPEIDMAEVFANDTKRSGAFLHPVSGPTQGTSFPTATLSKGWHTFGLNWEPGSLTWYVDGQPTFTTETGVPDQPMYMLINLAATYYVRPCLGASAPAFCTGTFSVKSVEIWQRPRTSDRAVDSRTHRLTPRVAARRS